MTTLTRKPETTRHQPRVVDVELLAIDLSTCTRCTGTLGNIEEAIAAVRRVAEPTGSSIRLRKTLIQTEEQALQHRFVSSPTIRINGRDIVFETRESRCDSCTDLCGCDEGTSCRVWSYQGQEHTEAPVGLVVEALLREIAGTSSTGSPSAASVVSFTVPENLRRFFAGRAGKEADRTGEAEAACCPPSELATCCAPTEKAACCAPAASTCGCN
jgi:hypothetical protein